MKLALRMLWRDWGSGELRLLALSVVVAVAAVTSVAWLAERVGSATTARAGDLIAADRAVEYPRSIPDGWIQQAQDAGLDTALTATFPSVVLAGERSQLVSVKAVSAGYPLRGDLRVRDQPKAKEVIAQAVPERGTAWAAPRLLPALALQVGQSISLGELQPKVSRLITLEPDRGGLFNNVAPRLMINIRDLPATGLIGRGSRVRYKLLLRGPDATLQAFTDALVAEQGNAVEIETPTNQRRGVAETVTKARRFLGLAALLTVVVSGVAVLLTVRDYAERQVTAVAVMRAVGATRRRLLILFAGRLFWLGLFAGALGALAGFVLHALMLSFVNDLLGEDLPPPGITPLITGWLTAFAALFGFALPTLLRLRDVPPMRVLRRDLGTGIFRGSAPLIVAAAVILVLMAWQARDWWLTAVVFGALLATLTVLAGGAYAVIAGVQRLYRRGGSARLLWLTGLTRRPWTAVVQIVAVGLGLMALFLLVVVRSDLLTAWRAQIPADAPNLFLINIQPDQRDAIAAFLGQRGIDTRFYPMTRARLISMNGGEVGASGGDSDRARDLAQREFNLSWADTPHPGNEVIAGEWWGKGDNAGQLSVEHGFAERLGLSLGDRLTFDVAGTTVTARVTNLREVNWDSFNVNFFVMASPGTFADVPTTWLTSIYRPPGSSDLLNSLVREYPSVTAIDVTSVLRTVRTIVDQGSRVVELMALLTLAAGMLVLLAALQITGEQRRFESALLRALGATGARVRRMVRLELWLVGAVSGLLAGVSATAAGAVAATSLFDLDYAVRPLAIVAAVVVGIATVWLAGGLGARRYYRTSPMQLLREGDD